MNEYTTRIIWVTKYALTSGVFSVQAETRDDTYYYSRPGADSISQQFCLGEWHLSLDEANAKAEKLRIKKIEALKKKITALEKLTFK